MQENCEIKPLAEIEFIKECDKLKAVLRQSSLYDRSRRENSAEHSWQLALAIVTFKDLANTPFDILRAMKMGLVHDIVEIDAGDTFVYDNQDGKFEREYQAAKRIFGIVPDQKEELTALWLAYEEQKCPESVFVGAIDRLLPILSACENNGGAWKRHGIAKQRVLERNKVIEKGSSRLWEIAREMIEKCYAENFPAKQDGPASN